MLAMTAQQKRVYDYVRTYCKEEGAPPTRAEIAQALGFRSVNAAVDHLKALEKKGYIERLGHRSRGIRILQAPVDDEPASEGLPLIGRVAAGSPVLATENLEHCLPVHADLFHPRADYLLRVKGMSMKDAGILDGDLLAVQKTSQVQHQDIVVARINDDVTVKRLSRTAGSIALLPENADFQPIQIGQADQFSIEGKVVGVIRIGT